MNTYQIKKKEDFSRVFRSGNYFNCNSFTINYATKIALTDKNFPRYGIVTSKKIGNAVKRNRIRRKLKAIVRKLTKKRGAINRDYTYIVFGKSNAYTEKQSVLMPAMIKCFKKLSK